MVEDSEGRTERFGGQWGPDRTGFTIIAPILRRETQAEILGAPESLDNLDPRVRDKSQATRLASLAAIIGDLAAPEKTAEPDFLLRKIKAAIKLTLPSERAGLREVLTGVKARMPHECGLQILHDKKTAPEGSRKGDWKVVVDFGGEMFSV